jgi:hypothetical protein
VCLEFLSNRGFSGQQSSLVSVSPFLPHKMMKALKHRHRGKSSEEFCTTNPQGPAGAGWGLPILSHLPPSTKSPNRVTGWSPGMRGLRNTWPSQPLPSQGFPGQTHVEDVKVQPGTAGQLFTYLVEKREVPPGMIH